MRGREDRRKTTRDTFAFTGDHVWGSDAEDLVEAGRDVSWCSSATHRAQTPAAMRHELLRLAAAM